MIAQPVGQRGPGMRVVKADIDRRTPLGRDHIGRQIAAINRGDRQRRGIEMRGARVQWRLF